MGFDIKLRWYDWLWFVPLMTILEGPRMYWSARRWSIPLTIVLLATHYLAFRMGKC